MKDAAGAYTVQNRSPVTIPNHVYLIDEKFMPCQEEL